MALRFVEPLPADAVLVHVGMFKTGTTAIQNRLSQARPGLPEHGVTYPGTGEAHHAAAQALRNIAGVDAVYPSPTKWDNLVEEVRSAPGRVVLSSEYLAQANAEQRSRLVDGVGRERVHVILGIRNPASHTISSWQQLLKDGRTGTYTDFLERCFRRDPHSEARPYYWRWWDPVRLVREWSALVGPNRFYALLLPEGDRELLGATFEQLLDLPAGHLNDIPVSKSNRSLTVVEAECLRQINLALKDELTPKQYARLIRFGLVQYLTDERRPLADERRSVLPQWAFDQACVEAERIRDGIAASGVHVVGDLASLTPPTKVIGAQLEPDPAERVAADLAAHATLGLLRFALEEPAPPPPPPSPVRRAVRLARRAAGKTRRRVTERWSVSPTN